MEHLKAVINGPPFQFVEVLALLSEADQLADTIESGSQPFDHEAAVKMTEALEALAAVGCVHAAYLGGYFQKLDEDNHGTPKEVANIEKAFQRLPDQVCRLKALIFGALHLPDLCSSPVPPGAAPVCQYCNWILERALTGLSDAGHEPIFFDDARYHASPVRSFFHLCIVDDWSELPALHHRAQIGCYLCSFLLELAKSRHIGLGEDERVQFWLEHKFSRLELSSEVGLAEAYLFVIPLAGTGKRDPLREEIWGYPELCGDFTRPIYRFRPEQAEEKSDLSRIGIYPAARDKVLGKANIDFLRGVLGRPREGHTTGFRPKRLIDLGPDPTSDLRLVITSNSSHKTMPYAALSYCWGPPEHAAWQVMTTPETIERHCARISLEDLPPVVKDAVEVCRHLDIRYLWVDAICILQGSSPDWEEQSRDMGKVFQGSWVTICAVQSSTCRQGFLHTRNRSTPIQNLGYKSPISPRHRVKITLRPTWEDPYFKGDSCQASLFLWDVNGSAWNARGWVFQEKLLAPRKAIFGNEMVYAQVGDRFFCENGTSTRIAGNDGDHRDPYLSFCLDLGNKSKQYLYYEWHRLVAKLAIVSEWTDDRDILPALSGISEMFAARLKDTFLAGVWEADLPAGLLWVTVGEMKPSLVGLLASFEQGQGRFQCAPSWSWASRRKFWHAETNGDRCRTRSHMRHEMGVIASRLRVDGNNPYGRLMKGGSLLVAGRTIATPTGFFITNDGRTPSTPYINGCRISSEEDWQDQRAGSTYHRLGIYLGGTLPDPERQAQQDAAEDALEDSVRLLLVCSCCTSHDDDGSMFFNDSDLDQATASASCDRCLDEAQDVKRDCWGIAICPAPGRDRGYLRVGMFTCLAQDGGLGLFAGAEKETIELF
ncbi:hypothetical protein MAPG_04793 [Magnaporthiopsis poae ATCC 64411]|uniref:Heterokaryon incompatibility domain-containing protein n=1 Tax=Magnaporthiopsis poae (strain ATCC 64411 / 73-15) TaxID=644358 RepID=A0A0C4DXN9_MAGP6|nr:hypothetical protein MAPG_04793 [Magnaporthiopsis poae ATCC 64411]